MSQPVDRRKEVGEHTAIAIRVSIEEANKNEFLPRFI
jgi:hypothetical protein